MWKFISYQILWGLIKYVVNNPYARKAAAIGCLSLLLIPIGMAVAATIVAVLGFGAAELVSWYRTPDGDANWIGIGLTVLAVVTILVLLVRRRSRRRQSDYSSMAKTRLGRIDEARPAGACNDRGLTRLPAGDLDRIRILDKVPDAGSMVHGSDKTDEEDLTGRIVIHRSE